MRPVWIATCASVSAAEVLGARRCASPPSAARRARVDIFFRLAGIAADRRVDPAPRLHDAPDQRDVFLFDLAIVELPRQLLVRASCLATTIRPDVPRSSRCTMPGRFSPPMPLRSSTWWSSALTSVPPAWPAAGCTTIPAGLFDDDEVAVLVDDVERKILRPAVAPRTGSGSVDARSLCRRVTALVRSCVAAPSTVTWPSLISRWICERDCCGTSAGEKPIEPLAGRSSVDVE